MGDAPSLLLFNRMGMSPIGESGGKYLPTPGRLDVPSIAQGKSFLLLMETSTSIMIGIVI